MNVTCQRQKQMRGPHGKYKKYCGKKSVVVDEHNRSLCLACFNKHQSKNK